MPGEWVASYSAGQHRGLPRQPKRLGQDELRIAWSTGALQQEQLENESITTGQMIFTDTHTHLYDEQLAVDEAEMIQRSLDAGVTTMYMPNCDSSTIAPMMSIAE